MLCASPKINVSRYIHQVKARTLDVENIEEHDTYNLTCETLSTFPFHLWVKDLE